MSNPFFDHPILNSPYEYPKKHWELDESGQPTQQVADTRRRVAFITPIPKPKKRKKTAAQDAFVFDEGKGLSTKEQQYDPTSIINEVRGIVDAWRSLPNPNQWQVTPETARLLQHWRHYPFNDIRPFFCQVEALEKVWNFAPSSSWRATTRLSRCRSALRRSATTLICRRCMTRSATCSTSPVPVRGTTSL
jgi:type III restriction enzyme